MTEPLTQCPRSAQVHYGRLLAFEVVSEEYEVHPMSYDPPEPPEYGCDYRVVYARNGGRAIVLATRAWRRANRWYFVTLNKAPSVFRQVKNGRYVNRWKLHSLTSRRLNDYGDENPFKGVRAMRTPTVEWIEAEEQRMEAYRDDHEEAE